MQPSDFTNENRVLILDAEVNKYCWCSRNEHSHPRKRLTRISPHFETEEDAVQWIEVHFLNQKNVDTRKVVPLFASLKPLYEK